MYHQGIIMVNEIRGRRHQHQRMRTEYQRQMNEYREMARHANEITTATRGMGSYQQRIEYRQGIENNIAGINRSTIMNNKNLEKEQHQQIRTMKQ